MTAPERSRFFRDATQIAVAALPFLISTGFVLTVYADTGVGLYQLARPLVFAVFLAAALQAVLSVTVRKLRTGSFVAGALLALVMDVRVGLLAIAALLATAYARRRGRDIGIGRVAAAIAVIFWGIAAVRVAVGVGVDPADLFRPSLGQLGVPVAGDPDIYVIWLDGYPRLDTLAESGYDNGSFDDELRNRGFVVAPASHSNYDYTALVLASMLNMEHVEEVPGLAPIPASSTGQNRALSAAINVNPVLRDLRSRGYSIVTAGLPDTNITVRSADEDLSGPELRSWERQVLARSSLWPLLQGFAVDQHRSAVLSTFEAIATSTNGRSDGRPKFMFAHVMSPHVPLTFDRDGGYVNFRCAGGCGNPFSLAASAIGLSIAEYRAAAAQQVQFINTLVLQAVDTIVAASPTAVVILLSDHGERADDIPTDEWFHSFFAARTPGHDGLFPDNARPIEVFPRLFDAYLGIHVSIPQDRTYNAAFGTRIPLITEEWLTTEGASDD